MPDFPGCRTVCFPSPFISRGSTRLSRDFLALAFRLNPYIMKFYPLTKMINNIKRRIRNVFITGLLITTPIALTLFILNFLFKNLDSFGPAFINGLILLGAPIPEGYRIPFLGMAMTLIIVFMIGALTTNIFGHKLVQWGEFIVHKIPFVRRIYSGTKQVLHSIAEADTSAFSRVVILEFPRRGMYVIAFVTSEVKGEVQDKTAENVVNIFVPTMPNPTSGFVIFSPESELIDVPMTIEEGIKYVISGGIVRSKEGSHHLKKLVTKGTLA